MWRSYLHLAQLVFGWYLFAITISPLPCVSAEPSSLAFMVEGQARFQVLAPMLVRMEYSPTARFIDAPSAAVLKGDWPTIPIQTRRVGGWREIETGKMTIRDRIGSGLFTAENLQVRWKNEQGDHVWKPGDKDDKNLGGVPAGDISHRIEPGNEPGALSRNGYFFLDDSRTAVRDAATEWVKPRPEKDSQDWYFFVYGREFKKMLGLLSQLLGPIPMIPRYVLGAWVSSRAAYSADEWKMIANRFREESVPMDMIGLDSPSTTKVVWSGYDTDPEQFPDPKEFFPWMLERGFRTFFNEHYASLTRESDSNFEAIRQLMGLPPDTEEIPHDLASKKYSRAFMDLLHKPLLDMGIAFWWQDGNAPANMPGLDPEMWTRHIEYEGSERITGKRGFVLCHMGSWGSHRYGSYFTGALFPYWVTLELLIPFGVQAGNMLLPYVANNSPGVHAEIVNRELYQRWIQFGALSSISWWHGFWGLRFPWEYGPQSLEISRQFLRLR